MVQAAGQTRKSERVQLDTATDSLSSFGEERGKNQRERVALAFSLRIFYGTAGRGVQGCD
jgi:hypothetical protein